MMRQCWEGIAVIDGKQHGVIGGDPFPPGTPYVVLHLSVLDTPHLLRRGDLA